MDILKPKLSVEQQVSKLKEKGVKFELCEENNAYTYLKANNNYFKLTSYRKNFVKIQNGSRQGMYHDLDFGHLIDLAIIDTRLRILIVEMALNIEHFAKVNLLNYVNDDEQEDGYSIVDEYIKSLSDIQQGRLQKEIDKNKENEYCGDIIEKYDGRYPIWAFIEILSLGGFLPFYKYCADKYRDKSLQDNFYLMLNVKCIRNAAAHNNCVINNLLGTTIKHRPNYNLVQDLAKQKQISRQVRMTQLNKMRVRQFVSLLYAHKIIVTSSGVHNHIAERLKDLTDRFFKKYDYEACIPLKNSLDFMKKVVDFWFKID